MTIPERLPRETGRDYALRTIKENIINLDLAPGSQISENELSAELGLSRTPIREALIELSKAKMLTVCPQKKSVVSLIDYDMVEQASFMRRVLESAVVQLVCEQATASDVAQLRANVQLQKFYLENNNREELQALDDQFHEMLFTIAQKPQIYVLMQTISIHFDRVRRLSLSSVKDLKIVQDHENIAEAIARKDAAEACALIEKHLNRYKIDEAAIRVKYPNYFKAASRAS